MEKFRRRKTAGMAAAACLALILGGCRAQPAPEEPRPGGCDVFAECGTEDAAGGSSFREKYEGVSQRVNNSETEYRPVSIPEDHPFVETGGDEVVSMIENKETFYLYVGDEMCPWCRSVIEMAMQVAAGHDVDRILYIEIWDDEGSEIFRDKYTLEEGKPVRTVEPGPGYEALLESFAGFLSDYTLAGDNGETVSTGEKRIYAPNFFYVEGGELKRFTTGISDRQENSHQELTEEMLEDEREAFEYLFG